MITATRRNMEAFPGSEALDLATGETFSATSGDYFQLGPDDPLTNANGDPLVLAVRHTAFLDPATGDEI